MQWSPMLDLCWQRDTYSDIGRSILLLTWIEFQRLRLEMIRRTFNIRSTAKPHQLLWESRPISGGGNTFYTGGCNSPFYWQQLDSFAFLFTFELSLTRHVQDKDGRPVDYTRPLTSIIRPNTVFLRV